MLDKLSTKTESIILILAPVQKPASHPKQSAVAPSSTRATSSLKLLDVLSTRQLSICMEDL